MHILSMIGTQWGQARKTKALRAKPMSTLLVDRAVTSKFLIDTLEAREPVDGTTVFCLGQANDAWQQSSVDLLKKYDVTAIDDEGWLVCTPKPGNRVDFFEVTKEHLDQAREVQPERAGHFVKAKWGESIGDRKNLQAVSVGDCVLRNPEDHADLWVVRKAIWLNTYTIEH